MINNLPYAVRKMAILYRHIRLDTNEPFYIGIGKTTSRAKSFRDRNCHWKNIVNKTDYRVDILLEDLTWEEVCVKEQEFITLYGRKDLGKGTLCNFTDGGQGNNGYKQTEKAKSLISINNARVWLGKKRPELSTMTIKKNKERVWSKESRSKMSNSKSGNKATFYKKFGKNHPTSKPIVCTTTSIQYEGVSHAARELGLNIGHIASVARGLFERTGHKKYPGGLHFLYDINTYTP
tara:strand:+ start:10268 stop:10972 length:705 start_codon:yes stop_codon:yes gene_type:complete